MFFFLFTVRIYDLLWNVHASRGISIPMYLSDQIENVQKRALRIIFPAMKYIDAISRAKLTTLHERRSILRNRFLFEYDFSLS